MKREPFFRQVTVTAKTPSAGEIIYEPKQGEWLVVEFISYRTDGGASHVELIAPDTHPYGGAKMIPLRGPEGTPQHFSEAYPFSLTVVGGLDPNTRKPKHLAANAGVDGARSVTLAIMGYVEDGH